MTQPHEDKQQHKEKYEYFVGNDKYEYDQSSITGAVIKSQIPNFDPSYSLMQEGQGNDPDTPIKDDTTISLAGKKPRFYLVPPANFGTHDPT